MPSPAFSTRVKLGINALLQHVGLEVRTTLEGRLETSRLNNLRAKGHWRTPRYDQGLKLEDEKWLAFMAETCQPYQECYNRFPHAPDQDAQEFYLNNGWYGAVDAEVLYCMLRHHHPRHVIEIGSGFSTRVMRRAIKEGQLETKITSIDPHPNTNVQPYSDTYIQLPVEEIEVAQLTDTLSERDILFIDSSHTVKTGGDVPFIFLEVLPRLKPGVFVHVHDIFLPFDYPEEWVTDRWGWTEQYLVHAFLSYNEVFEIVWPASYMWQYHRGDMTSAMPNSPSYATPSSLWLRKVL